MADLSKYDPININEIKKEIPKDVIELLERTVFETNFSRSEDVYMGNAMFVVHYDKLKSISSQTNEDGTINHCEKCAIVNINTHIKFTQDELFVIHKWLEEAEHHIYFDNMFRIDMEDKILLVEVYNIFDGIDKEKIKEKILYGFILKNDLASRFSLAEKRQDYIMQHFM